MSELQDNQDDPREARAYDFRYGCVTSAAQNERNARFHDVWPEFVRAMLKIKGHDVDDVEFDKWEPWWLAFRAGWKAAHEMHDRPAWRDVCPSIAADVVEVVAPTEEIQ